jgi:hypothetical protein
MDNIAFSRGATLTISSGAITVTQRNHIVAAETGTTDDLATITNGINFSDNTVEAQIRLQADTGDTITLKHGTGNIQIPGGTDFTLASDATVILEWDDFDSVWRVPSTIATATTIEGTSITSTGEDDGEILVADGADGVAWELQPLYLIGSSVLGAAAASMAVSSIPATYRALIIRTQARSVAAASSNNILLYMNADTTATNYSTQRISTAGDGAAVSTAASKGTVGGIQGLFSLAHNTDLANSYGQGEFMINQYAGTSYIKNALYRGGTQILAATSASNMIMASCFGSWHSTAAITAVTAVTQAGNNLDAGSAIWVYGVK